MSFILYNANPFRNNTSDCVVRAISLAEGIDWDTTYLELSLKGYELKAPFDVNYVWGAYLKSKNYIRDVIPNTCPDCYTIKDFVSDNPKGVYILATHDHVVAVKDGNYFDTADSGNEIPIYFWKKEVK